MTKLDHCCKVSVVIKTRPNPRDIAQRGLRTVKSAEHEERVPFKREFSRDRSKRLTIQMITSESERDSPPYGSDHSRTFLVLENDVFISK